MVETVFICTGTDTHARVIKDAEVTQKHIFCEKPIAPDLPEINGALASGESRVVLQLGLTAGWS